MPPPIGFVLLTHAHPAQLGRLARRLDAMFDRPPMVCHHDFGRCPLGDERLPPTLAFVRPHLPTGWGEFSVVEGTVRAVRQLYADPPGPDWFVLLSGACYPVKPAARVLADLGASPADAHIHVEPIRHGRYDRDWQRLCYDRYCTVRFRRPHLTRRLRPGWRAAAVRHPLLARPLLPFSAGLRCYAGSQWFCGSRRAAAAILRFHDTRPALARHYRTVPNSEESYFQTVLANAPGLVLGDDRFRYIDWSAGGPHPKTLGRADLPAVAASPAHFARKFAPGDPDGVLDHLDALTA